VLNGHKLRVDVELRGRRVGNSRNSVKESPSERKGDTFTR